jgi:rsbT antagonist protein RsbS
MMSGENITVIKVRNVLMVAMPAEPDDMTVSNMQEQVLHSMEKYEAKGLVLDISLVDTVDSFFARTKAETAQMVALLGGSTIIAGMRPSVAITVTQLGLTLGNALTALNADCALDMLMDITERM